MQVVFLIGLAGAMGAIARYALSSLAAGVFGAAFPWGIFLVNMAGCFLFGIVSGLAGRFSLIDDTVRLILLTGFMGSFTTFSTFMFDSYIMGKEGRLGFALLNVAGQILVGLICLWGGQKLVEVLSR